MLQHLMNGRSGGGGRLTCVGNRRQQVEKSTAYLGSHVKWRAQGCRMVEQLADSGNGAGMVQNVSRNNGEEKGI